MVENVWSYTRGNEWEWFASIEGVVTVIYEKKHAIGITSKNGSELLLHIGLPFDMKVLRR